MRYKHVIGASTILLSAEVRAQWVQHGPGPNTLGQVEHITDREVAGAIKVVATHPTEANIIYVGAVNGGIWKTSNALDPAGPKWTEQLGGDRSLSIGALEFDPTDATHNTLVAGSGRFSSFYSVGGDLVGLWRTTDGGSTWTALDGGGVLARMDIAGVAPRGATIVVAAERAQDPANVGLWRSTDAGQTWTRLSDTPAAGLPVGRSFTLASDPSDVAHLYTNAGRRGIYKSTDTGATWIKVSDATMDAQIAVAQRVLISVGARHSVFVAIVADGKLSALFQSPDAGASWKALQLPVTLESEQTPVGIHPGRQGARHLSLAADPRDGKIAYIGGDRQPCWSRSVDGKDGDGQCFPNALGAEDFSGRLFRLEASGARGGFRAITHDKTRHNSAPHADSRNMAIASNGDLVEVDDGGIYRRTSPGSDGGDWLSLNGDINVTEIHDVAWDGVARLVVSGTQDTGVPQQQTTAGRKWESVSTGDGGDVAVDDRSTPGRSVRITSAQRLRGFRRATYDATNHCKSEDIRQPLVLDGDTIIAQFITPIQLNAANPRRLLIGALNGLYESDDQGETVTEIAPRLVVNSDGSDPIAYGAADNPDIVYVGMRNEIYIRTEPSPAAFTPSPSYPGRASGRWVLGITNDPQHALKAFAVDSFAVYRTTDAGASWAEITGNLRSVSPGRLLSIAYASTAVGEFVFVGTSRGVYAARGPSFDEWAVVGSGLPRVPVYDLDVGVRDQVLVAGTLGRGAWTLDLHKVTVGKQQ